MGVVDGGRVTHQVPLEVDEHGRRHLGDEDQQEADEVLRTERIMG